MSPTRTYKAHNRFRIKIAVSAYFFNKINVNVACFLQNMFGCFSQQYFVCWLMRSTICDTVHYFVLLFLVFAHFSNSCYVVLFMLAIVKLHWRDMLPRVMFHHKSFLWTSMLFEVSLWIFHQLQGCIAVCIFLLVCWHRYLSQWCASNIAKCAFWQNSLKDL